MSSHQAAGPMIGYLYQLRYALLLLLENGHQSYKISIEKFDDIAFEDGNSPKELIQTKHHATAGNLGDKSVDLWKTIKVWLDQLEDHSNLFESCRFLIITTQIAAENSAASLLKISKRNEKEAISILKKVAQEHKNESLKEAYDKFLLTDERVLESLFQAIEVVDGAPEIRDVEIKLKKTMRFCCPFQYLDKVMDQIEGWWFRHGINALTSSQYSMPDYSQVYNKIVSVGSLYQLDNLPIEEWETKDLSEDELKKDQRVFIQQLRLINGNSSLLRRAIKNYYRACQQRSSWIRDDLLLPDELEKYEKRLVDEWDEVRAHLDDDGDAVKQGKHLYDKTMERNITIRKCCTEPYVMRGSYEMLSDRLQVGWHRDYFTILNLPHDNETGDTTCANGKCDLRK